MALVLIAMLMRLSHALSHSMHTHAHTHVPCPLSIGTNSRLSSLFSRNHCAPEAIKGERNEKRKRLLSHMETNTREREKSQKGCTNNKKFITQNPWQPCSGARELQYPHHHRHHHHHDPGSILIGVIIIITCLLLPHKYTYTTTGEWPSLPSSSFFQHMILPQERKEDTEYIHTHTCQHRSSSPRSRCPVSTPTKRSQRECTQEHTGADNTGD